MPNNLPASDTIDIRDYIYIDRQRVGSLLAQFVDGLPQTAEKSKRRSSTIRANIAKIVEFDKGGESSSSTMIALADLHVSQLEENAEALGSLKDISHLIHKRKNWLRSKVRNSLEPGMLVRVTANTQISDTESILSIFRSMNSAFSNPENDTEEQLEQIVRQMGALYGSCINLSIFPSEDADDQVAFVGEIPHDHTFTPLKNDLILAQIGPATPELTTLFQVAAVPTENDANLEIATITNSLNKTVGRANFENGIDRRMLDSFILSLEKLLAGLGFASAPKWPAISIIPLAVYRQVPSVRTLNDAETEEKEEEQ